VSPGHVLKVYTLTFLVEQRVEARCELLVSLKVVNAVLPETFHQDVLAIHLNELTCLDGAIISITQAVLALIGRVTMRTGPGNEHGLEVHLA
jgi:hypothetical protein